MTIQFLVTFNFSWKYCLAINIFQKKKLVEGVTKYKTSKNIFGKENNMHLLAQAKKNLSRHSDIFPFHCVFLKPK